MRLLSLLVLLPGCWLQHLGGGDLRDIETASPPENAEAVIAWVHHEYELMYPESDMWQVAEKVYWTNTLCPGTSYTAVVYNDRCYAGIMFRCNEIYVARRDNISQSALVHELGHCYRLAVYGNGDLEHMDTEWWDENSFVNNRLDAGDVE